MSESTNIETLPWICPDHPTSQVRHVWDQTHYVLNERPAGTGMCSNHHYECATCGRRLREEE